MTDLPPILTGELIADEGEDEFIDLRVLARSLTPLKYGIPMANTTFELCAWVEHYGVNVEVCRGNCI